MSGQDGKFARAQTEIVEKLFVQMLVILIYNLKMNSNRPPIMPVTGPGLVPPLEASPAAVAMERWVPRVSSHTIFSGAQELEIEHNGALYRLRQTSLGKLILTK